MYKYGAWFPTSLTSYPKSAPQPKPPPPPPPPPKGCVDFFQQCLQWASQGNCESNTDWMMGTATSLGNCQQACGLCDNYQDNTNGQTPVADCADQNDNWWVAPHET